MKKFKLLLAFTAVFSIFSLILSAQENDIVENSDSETIDQIDEMPPEDGLEEEFDENLPLWEKDTYTLYRTFFFEITRCALTGKTDHPLAREFADVSRAAASFFMLPFWDNPKGPVYLYEKVWPEYKGVLQKDKVVIENDDSWLEEAKKKLEEKTQQPLKDEELLDSLDGKDEKGTKQEEETPVEVYHTAKDGQLRKFLYDGEEFSVSSLGDKTYLVKAGEKTVTRRTFNRELLLELKETFSKPVISEDMELLSSVSYEYSLDKVLEKTVEENKKENSSTTTLFDSNKRVSSVKKGIREKEKLVPSSDTSFEYDLQGRLIKKLQKQFKNTKNKKGKTVTQTDTLLYKFVYTENSSNPDEYYYEDDILRVKHIWFEEKKSRKTMYFDEDFSIMSEYDDGFKVLEVFYLGEIEMRRKYYEKTE